MTDSISGLPFWEAFFDADGDPDGARRDAMVAEVRDRGLTDLVIFAHGWSTEPTSARRLYDGFFGLLAGQLPAARRATVGLAGVMWPSMRWADEPIPDFTPAPAMAGAGGAASLGETAPAAPLLLATVDPATLTLLHAQFPAAAAAIDGMAALLQGPPTDEAMAAFLRLLAEFADHADTGPGDGAGDGATPGMLAGDPVAIFRAHRDALRAAGADLTVGPDADSGGGAAGFGDLLGGIWHGAKEALRGTSYWAMKNRAGVVGRAGLGPLLGALHAAAPGLRVHLVGHSFGARLVSFALTGLPDGASPVASLTLLQGAFSHFAFAHPLPLDGARDGALAGLQAKVGGPLTVCFSAHDGAVGTFYPMASMASGEDAAGLADELYRWGGMGADGAQGVDALLDGIRPAGPDAGYRFRPGRFLNVDASEIVRVGGPPSGAHSDIVHPELTWVVAAAAGLV